MKRNNEKLQHQVCIYYYPPPNYKIMHSASVALPFHGFQSRVLMSRWPLFPIENNQTSPIIMSRHVYMQHIEQTITAVQLVVTLTHTEGNNFILLL